MKVVLVNHSDTRGGASVVTTRLLHALRRAGVDARMLVMHKATDDPDIAVAGTALERKACFAREHVEILMHNGFNRKNLFKTSIATCGLPLHRHPWIQQADVVVLAWINQGMLSLEEIGRIEAPIVWTMHDMWPATGVCHHAEECLGYLRECGNCRLLGGKKENDLSRTTLLRKQALYDSKEGRLPACGKYGPSPIRFVAVSHWLERKCRQSSLLKERDVRVIPNAFPVADFWLTPSAPRSAYGLPEGRKLVVMGAARLDDPIKGLDYAVEALNKIRDLKATAVFYGNLRDKHALDALRLPYVWLGPISDWRTLADIYAHADCVLSTSHYECLPGTLIEGMAAGCVPVTFGYGGQADIVDHLRTGYIAQYHKADDVAEGLRWALSGRVDPKTLRAVVTVRFSDDAVARRYIELFNEILEKK